MISRLIGVACIAFVIIGGIGIRNIQYFIDPASMICVGLIVLGGILMSFGWEGLYGLLRMLIGRVDDTKFMAKVCDAGSFFSIVGGVFGTLIGWVLMLQNLDDPAALGPGMAVAVITIIYGIILDFAFFKPLKWNLNTDEPSEGNSAYIWLTVGWVTLFTALFMLVMAMSD